jgi:hypothetical protein
MKLIALSAVCALMATTALGQDVPFASPPLSQPGQPDTSNLVSLGDIMQLTQMQHIKLWYAGKSQNWELASFEINRIKENLRRAVILYTNIPIELQQQARRSPACRMPPLPATPRNSSSTIRS